MTEDEIYQFEGTIEEIIHSLFLVDAVRTMNAYVKENIEYGHIERIK